MPLALTQEGKEELALALLLLKDLKTQYTEGQKQMDTYIQVIRLADMLGVRKEFDEHLRTFPPFSIEFRDG